eukprot:tig00000852_g5025.t1
MHWTPFAELLNAVTCRATAGPTWKSTSRSIPPSSSAGAGASRPAFSSAAALRTGLSRADGPRPASPRPAPLRPARRGADGQTGGLFLREALLATAEDLTVEEIPRAVAAESQAGPAEAAPGPAPPRRDYEREGGAAGGQGDAPKKPKWFKK